MNTHHKFGYPKRPWVLDSAAKTELEGLEEGIIVADRRGMIVFANTSAITMHGRLIMGAMPDDYSPLHGLFTEDGRPYPSTDLPLARAVLFGESVSGARWRIRRPDGSSIAAAGDAMPLKDAKGEQNGALLIFRQT